MAKRVSKNNPLKNASAPASGSTFSGGSVLKKRTESGIKLELQPDSECILRFEAYEDISHLCKPPKNEGEAIQLKFFDGRRIVNIAAGFAMKQVKFETNKYYYLQHKGNVETSQPQAMKDIEVTELGVDGTELNCDSRVSDSGKIILSPENIEAVNYHRINYPFRHAE